jgi:NADPH:quinone reductase-like Zn-dependent oxidoreductase
VKAIIQDGYGSIDVLRLDDIEPPALRDDEVLVRVHAASVHPDVWHMMRGLPYVLRIMGGGLRRPNRRVPGTDMAGTIEAIGPRVTRFQVGDDVFGETVKLHQWTNGGAYAEYVAVNESKLARKPANVSYAQAAAVPTSGLIALRSLREQGRLQAGQAVLINGAAGGVGSLAVQIAKAFGAIVTGVDSTDKLELMRSLGADHVIDYTQDDFTQRPERYDLIVDVPGNHPLSACRRALTRDGTYVLVAHDQFNEQERRWMGSLPRMLGLMALTPFVRHLRSPKAAVDTTAPLEVLSELLASGKLRPMIDRTYPLSGVLDAMNRLTSGDARGKIIISCTG